MKRTWYKIMFALIKKIIVVLLTSLVNESNHTKCISSSNQKCKIQANLINLGPNEYSIDFHYYPFTVKLDRCVGSCNTLKDLSNKVCIPNKTEDLNLSVFNMTAGIFESKTLTKHLSYECKCRFDGKNVTEINVGITINANMGIKNIYPTKNYVWNPATCNCENGKYLASIMDDSAIICDEVIKL